LEPEVVSCVASWKFTSRNDGVALVHRQRFANFAEAHEMNNVIAAAYDAGLRAGDKRVCSAVRSAIRAYS
jgi:hypothetical protein